MNFEIERMVERYAEGILEQRRKSVIEKYKLFMEHHVPECMVADLKKFAEKEGIELGWNFDLDL